MTDLLTKTPKLDVDDPWHLARDEDEARLTAFELRLERVVHAYHRWKSACMAAVGDQDFAGDYVAVLNVIRMRERPKSRVEIARVLNRDDTSNIQYALRKLLRAGLIEKVDAVSRKTATYRTTAKGIEVTEAYSDLRNELMIGMTGRLDDDGTALREAGDLLDTMSGFYDQAAKLAATRRY